MAKTQSPNMRLIGYVPPKTVEELLQRYKNGERYFSFAEDEEMSELITVTSLPNANLKEANLENINLEGADLRNASMSGANLKGVDITEADLQSADFTNADLESAKLRCSVANKAIFTKANLKKTNLSEGQFTNASFKEANLEEAVLTKGYFNSATFDSITLRETVITKACMYAVSFKNVDFNYSRCAEAIFVGADFTGSILNGFFENVDFSGVKFTKVSFWRSVFDDTDLTQAKIHDTNIDDLDFKGVKSFSNTEFVNVIINHDKWDSLRMEEKNKLVLTQIRSLNIKDDFAKLQLTYSGFLQWIHLFSMIIFITPYAYYLLYLSLISSSEYSSSNPRWLIARFLEFVYTGGQLDFSSNWYPSYSFILFILSLMYNIIRFRLLWKTKSMELESKVVGYRVKFSFDENKRLKWIYEFAKWGFIINISIAIIHTILFMMRYVP